MQSRFEVPAISHWQPGQNIDEQTAYRFQLWLNACHSANEVLEWISWMVAFRIDLAVSAHWHAGMKLMNMARIELYSAIDQGDEAND